MASKKQNSKRPAALAESAQPATATRNRAPLDLEALPDATATRKAAAQAAAIAAAQAAIERGKTALNPASYAQAARSWQPAISAPSDWLPDFAETETADMDKDLKGNRPDGWNCEGPAIVKIAAAVIFKRLQFPKAESAKPKVYQKDCKHGKAGEVTKATREKTAQAIMPRLLTPEDFKEIFQTCAAVLSQAGVINLPKIPGNLWYPLFRECRKALRITRQGEREISNDLAIEQATATTSPDGESLAIARQRLARRLNHFRDCIHKAMQVSDKRQRRFVWRQNHKRLRYYASNALRFSEMSDAEAQKACKDRAKLFAAIAEGETAYTLEAEREAAARCKATATAQAAAIAAAMKRLE